MISSLNTPPKGRELKIIQRDDDVKNETDFDLNLIK